jgi:hypothetical protein
MSANRRDTFRAASTSSREATLLVGSQSLRVQIADESSGGLCVSAGSSPGVVAGSTAQLVTDDGDRICVQVVHQENAGLAVRIGLKRVEPDVAARRTTSPLMMLIGLTLGLWAGALIPAQAIARIFLGR